MVRLGACLLALFLGAGTALSVSAAAADPALDGWVVSQQLVTNPTGQPVITPVQAEGLVRAVWDQRLAGAAIGSPDATAALETGPAAEFENLSLYGDSGSITGLQVYVPRQLAYPAYFLSLVSTQAAGRADRQDGLVFTRSATSAPWKLAIDSAFTGWDQLASGLKVDAFLTPLAVPPGDQWTAAREQGWFYGVQLTGALNLACWAVRSTTTANRSWFYPQRIINPQTGRPNYYTTLTTTELEQDCALLPATVSDPDPDLYRLGSMRKTVAVSGFLQPPPWLWIGVAGAILVLLSGVLLSRLRAPVIPDAKAEEPQPAARPARVVPFTARERAGVLTALLMVGIELAVIVEVIRWIAPAQPVLAASIAALALLWVVVLSSPWPRRIHARSSLLIAAAPHRVWAALTNELDQRIWSPEMQSIERISGTGGVGTLYRQVQRSKAGGLLEADKLVTVYEPEHRYVLRYPKLWQPQEERYTLEPDPAGTVLTYEHAGSIGPLTAVCGGILSLPGFSAMTQAKTAACLRRVQARALDQAPPDKAEELEATEQTTAPSRRRSPRAALLLGAGIMVVSGLLSLGGYALLFGAVFGSLVMAVIVIHELGHYAEARRQGVPVRLPFFIPFVGAAVTMRRMPGDAGSHARIALAGPLAGTLAVAAACVAAGPTNAQGLILFAQIGGLLNLVNLTPMSVLDGGAILAPLSRWVSVFGLLVAISLIAGVVAIGQFSLLVIVIAALAVVTVVNRFRQHRTPYYRSVRRRTQLLIGSVWLLVGLYLFFVTGVTDLGLILS